MRIKYIKVVKSYLAMLPFYIYTVLWWLVLCGAWSLYPLGIVDSWLAFLVGCIITYLLYVCETKGFDEKISDVYFRYISQYFFSNLRLRYLAYQKERIDTMTDGDIDHFIDTYGYLPVNFFFQDCPDWIYGSNDFQYLGEASLPGECEKYYPTEVEIINGTHNELIKYFEFIRTKKR